MQKAREAKKTRLEADTDMECEQVVIQKEITTAEYEYKIPRRGQGQDTERVESTQQ